MSTAYSIGHYCLLPFVRRHGTSLAGYPLFGDYSVVLAHLVYWQYLARLANAPRLANGAMLEARPVRARALVGLGRQGGLRRVRLPVGNASVHH